MDLYFECYSGISGDMSVGALLDLGADRKKLDRALSSMKLNNEFSYTISKKAVNDIMTTDFDVTLLDNHHHTERNLYDIYQIIDNIEMEEDAKNLAKRIFEIVAESESTVHGSKIEEIHFHEIGAIDSIVDIVSFAVLFYDINPKNVYISSLADGIGFVDCAHGTIPVPVPAVLEIVSKYGLKLKITNNEGEMVTPTGAAILASIYKNCQLKNEIIIEKTGYGRGKRAYKNPILRVMKIR